MELFERKTLNRQLMESFNDAVLSGKLVPGSKLPAENELALSFGVSRNTLREVIRMLEIFGIIESRHGQGTFLSEFALQRIPGIDIIKDLSGNHSVQVLMDTRLIIEPGLAAMAAERRTEEDLLRLAASRANIMNEAQRPDLDELFHMQVARAAKCDLTENFLKMTLLQLYHTPYPALQDQVAPSYNEEEIREHESILDSIRKQDPEEAAGRMREHLLVRVRMLQ